MRIELAENLQAVRLEGVGVDFRFHGVDIAASALDDKIDLVLAFVPPIMDRRRRVGSANFV